MQQNTMAARNEERREYQRQERREWIAKRRTIQRRQARALKRAVRCAGEVA